MSSTYNISIFNRYNYEVKSVEKFKMSVGVVPKVLITFQVKNQDGSVVLNKD